MTSSVVLCLLLLGCVSTVLAVGYVPSYQPPRYPSYVPSPPQEPREDMIDLLYSRVADINTQNAFLRETVESLEAQLTVSNTVLQKLTHIVIPYLQQNEVNQDRSLDDLEAHYTSLESFLDDLNATMSAVSPANAQNADDIKALLNRFAEALLVDTNQDGDIAELLSLIRRLKQQLVWYMENEFTLFNDRVERIQNKATDTKQREFGRICETGSAGFSRGSPRAEYVFRNNFPSVPGVVYTISLWRKNLPEKSTPSYTYGYGYPPPPPPVSIGSLILADVTQKSVTFRGVALDFGGVTPEQIRIDFQACSYPPSTTLVGLDDGEMPVSEPPPTDVPIADQFPFFFP